MIAAHDLVGFDVFERCLTRGYDAARVNRDAFYDDAVQTQPGMLANDDR